MIFSFSAVRITLGLYYMIFKIKGQFMQTVTMTMLSKMVQKKKKNANYHIR